MHFRPLRSPRRASYELAVSPSTGAKPTEVLHLPPESLRPSLLGFVLVVALQLSVVIVLITVIFVDIILQHYNDTLTTLGQNVYTAVTTLVATLIATITEAETRRLWTYVTVNGRTDDKKSRRTAVMIGLSTLRDLARTSYIPVFFVIAGLVTTAIVTGLQPTSMTVVRDMPITLSRNRNYTSAAPFILGNECNRPYDSESSSRAPTKWFNWELPDGGNLTVQGAPWEVDAPKCPTYSIRSVFETLDNWSLSFTLPGGISVDRFAAGVPFNSIYDSGISGPAFDYYDVATSKLGTWALRSFEWATMCVPTIKERVATCKPADDLSRRMDNIDISYGNCTVSRAFNADFETSYRSGEMVAGACTEGRPVGKATVLIGATSSDYATQLCNSITGSPTFTYPYLLGDDSCAIACEIDVTSSLTFRRLLIRPISVYDEQRHVWEVVGAETSTDGKVDEARYWGEECTPHDAGGVPLDVSDFLTETSMAVGAAASWQLLAENMYEDGYLSTLLAVAADDHYEYALNIPGWEYAEGAPGSIMEELLTMASRMALGFHYGTYPSHIELSDEEADEYAALWTEVWGGQNAHTSVRVGTKEGWAVIFVLPSLFTTVVLGVLWWRVTTTREIESATGGEGARETSRDS